MELSCAHTYIYILVTVLVSEVCAFPCRGSMCSRDLLPRKTEQDYALSKLLFILQRLFSDDDDARFTSSVDVGPFSRLQADSVRDINESPKKKWGPYNRFLRIGRSPEKVGAPSVGKRNYLKIGKLPSSVFVQSSERFQRNVRRPLNGVIRAGQ